MSDLLRLLPKVLRARDFHLYLEGGKRLTDLWLYGGKAVLGHKPPRVLVEMKNAAERGLFSPFPHPLERRFIKALEVFFPGKSFRIYKDEGSLLAALAEAGFCTAIDGRPLFPEPSKLRHLGLLKDPAFPLADEYSGNQKPAVSLWRPFLEGQDKIHAEDEKNNIYNAPVLIPVLPCPLGPAVLVLDKSVETSFPPGDLVPPVLLAPAARAIYNMAAAIKAKAPNRGNPRLPKVEKALQQRISGGDKPNGQVSESCIWCRRGIYLTLARDIGTEEYTALFKRFLEGGFLIPPSPHEPLILPQSMSPGEEAKLAALLSG